MSFPTYVSKDTWYKEESRRFDADIGKLQMPGDPIIRNYEAQDFGAEMQKTVPNFVEQVKTQHVNEDVTGFMQDISGLKMPGDEILQYHDPESPVNKAVGMLDGLKQDLNSQGMGGSPDGAGISSPKAGGTDSKSIFNPNMDEFLTGDASMVMGDWGDAIKTGFGKGVLESGPQSAEDAWEKASDQTPGSDLPPISFGGMPIQIAKPVQLSGDVLERLSRGEMTFQDVVSEMSKTLLQQNSNQPGVVDIGVMGTSENMLAKAFKRGDIGGSGAGRGLGGFSRGAGEVGGEAGALGKSLRDGGRRLAPEFIERQIAGLAPPEGVESAVGGAVKMADDGAGALARGAGDVGGDAGALGAAARRVDVDPATLRFREDDQTNLAGVRRGFPDDEYTPITAIRQDDGSLEILDGHNRAKVATERGHKLPVVEVSAKEVAELLKAGFDDIEISWAVLSRAGENDAAEDIVRQFPGAKVVERGEKAWDLLESMPKIRNAISGRAMGGVAGGGAGVEVDSDGNIVLDENGRPKIDPTRAVAGMAAGVVGLSLAGGRGKRTSLGAAGQKIADAAEAAAARGRPNRLPGGNLADNVPPPTALEGGLARRLPGVPTDAAKVTDSREGPFLWEGGQKTQPGTELPARPSAPEYKAGTPYVGDAAASATGASVNPQHFVHLGDNVIEAKAVTPEARQLAFPGVEPQKLEWWRKRSDRTRNVIKSFGDAGEEIFDRARTWRNDAEKMAADYIYNKMPTVEKMNSKVEFKNMVDVLEGAAKPMNGRVAQAASEARSVLSDIYKTATEEGVKVASARENYFPHMFKGNVMDMINDKVKRQEIREYLIRTKQAANNEAVDVIFSRFLEKSNDRRHGNLEMERIADLPGYERTKGALYAHILGASRRISEIRQFGVDDAIYKGLRDKLGSQGYDVNVADEMFNIIVGAKVHDEYKSANFMRHFVAFTRLGLSAIGNLTGGSANLISVVGVIKAAQTAPKALWSKEEKHFADVTGSTLTQVLKELREGQGWTDKVIPGTNKSASDLAMPGFNAVETFMRRWSAVAGREFADDMARKAVSGNVTAKRALDKMGLDVDGVLKRRGVLTENEQIDASRSIVERTQGRVDPQDLPGWATSPWGRVVAQFRTYGYNQNMYIGRELIDEAVKGNVAPLVRYAIIGTLGVAAAQEGRNAIVGRDREEDPVKYALQAISGNMGLVGDLGRAIIPINADRLTTARHVSMILGALGGPSVGAISDAAASAIDASKGDFESAGRTGLRQLPVVGSILQNRLLPYKAPGGPSEGSSSSSRSGARAGGARSSSGSRPGARAGQSRSGQSR